jgi:hypothetical protein
MMMKLPRAVTEIARISISMYDAQPGIAIGVSILIATTTTNAARPAANSPPKATSARVAMRSMNGISIVSPCRKSPAVPIREWPA